MSASLAPPQISLFRSQIMNRRFDEVTLAILEALVVSKDVKSSLEVRSSLKQLMRSESIRVLQEIAQSSVEQKLTVLEFFVRAFAVIGDFESCLALRYEALLLREFKTANHQWLKVNYVEWIKFAEHSMDNGFYSIAGMACENALAILRRNNVLEVEGVEDYDAEGFALRAERLKDKAIRSAAPCSVKAEAAVHLKKKLTAKSSQSSSGCPAKQLASSLFRDGIRKRNARNLRARQNLEAIGPGRVESSIYNLECMQQFTMLVTGNSEHLSESQATLSCLLFSSSTCIL